MSAFISAKPSVYARSHGDAAVLEAERETFRTVSEIGRVAATEDIDCGFVHSGQLGVAFSLPQLERLRASVACRLARGLREDDIRMLDVEELRSRVRLQGALGASFSPHNARIDPARLVRGLADACERHGVVIYERTPAVEIGPRRVVTTHGTVTAGTVIRATEAYTAEQRGQGRRFLPLYSLMVATEPLPGEVWDELGWSGRETISDQHHLFFYAQRTTDDRIAIGGRGAPYKLGDADPRGLRAAARGAGAPDGVDPAALRARPARARITHHWGGPLGVPRDWCTSVVFDPPSGFGWAGGYAGHGVVAASISGRTLADLILAPRHRADAAAVGRPRRTALGAGAAPIHREPDDRRHPRLRRSPRGPHGPHARGARCSCGRSSSGGEPDSGVAGSGRRALLESGHGHRLHRRRRRPPGEDRSRRRRSGPPRSTASTRGSTTTSRSPCPGATTCSS